MQKMKKIKTVLAAAVVGTAVLFTAAAQTEPRVFVNGTRLDADVLLVNDRTYIPLRAVSEAMGAEVLWDDANQCAYVNFSEEDAIAKLVEDVSPGVVAIIGNYKSDNPLYQYNKPTVQGSGVIYKSNGYILTNAHVVRDITNLTVVLNDGTSLAGSVIFADDIADLAIVRVNRLGLTAVKMADASTIASGKTAIAIGTPISMSMRNSVTKGIISGTQVALPDSYYKLIQTDTTINPGNSGGALLNTKGELIGITSSKYAGTGIDNMSFAIPIDTVQTAIAQFEQYGIMLRPDFGITLEQSWEASIGLPTKKGLTVKTAPAGTLSSGDVVFEVNGIAVSSTADWNEALKSTYNGADANVKYRAGGENGEVKEITLTAIKS